MKNIKIGDNVKKWSYVTDIRNNRKLGKEIWKVKKVYLNANSQSGILLDVFIGECPCCGANERTMVGYDSSWFVKVEGDSDEE